MPDTPENSRNRNFSNSSTPSSSSSDTSSQYSLSPPPDGGWGWMVVLGSFVVHLIADGCAFSIGVFYMEMLDYFRETKGKTTWVGSLFVSVPLFMGPVASAITNKYGCRRTTMTGGFIAALGCILSVFAPSINILCITFGLIAGFGLSLVYMPAVVVVAFYFEKKRAFATGIAVSGSGVGTFIIAPLTEFLIARYTWKGAMLIVGGIMLNIVVCGALFRPLITKREKKRKKFLRSLEKFSRHSSRLSFHEYSKAVSNSPKTDMDVETRQKLYNILSEPVSHSLTDMPTYLKDELNHMIPDIFPNSPTIQDIFADQEMLQQLRRSVGDIPGLSSEESSSPVRNKTQVFVDDSGRNLISSTSVVDKPKKDLWRQRTKLKPGLRSQLPVEQMPLSRKDIFYRGSLIRMGHSLHNKASSCPNIFVHSASSSESDLQDRCMEIPGEIKHIMKKMMDFSIMKDVLFLYFCIANMLLYMWYDVPYLYVPDKAVEKGMPEKQASFLISILGIVNTLAQVLIGYIGDHPRVSSVQLYNLLTSAAGIATALVPLCYNQLTFSVYAGAFGFLISGNYALTTIILVELVGMDKLTNAFGILMLTQGIANLVGPPLAGWLSDVTRSYDPAFIIAGAFIFISGFMLTAVPCLKKLVYRKQQDKEDCHDSIPLQDVTGNDVEYIHSHPKPRGSVSMV